MGLFDMIFGKDDKVSDPYESEFAKKLKDNLHNMATGNQNKYDPNKEFNLPTYADYDTSAYKNANNAALNDYKNQFGNYQNTMGGLMEGQLGKGYTDQLNSIRDNNLQLAQSQIDSASNKQVGGLLSGLANRGVINSSVMGDSAGQIGKSAANAMADAANRENVNYNNGYMNSLGQSANMAGQQFGAANNLFGNAMNSNNANLQGDMAGQQFDSNKLQSDINRYGFNQQFNNQAFQNAWSPFMQMYQIEQGKQPTVQQGSSGLLGSFLNSGMQGLGTMLPFMMSDKRLKTNIQYTGEFIDETPVATFKYLADPAQKTYAGFIAQDVMEVHPERVEKNSEGYYLIRTSMFSRMPVG